MAVQTISFETASPTFLIAKSSRTRKFPRALVSWPMIYLSVFCIIATAQAQTFQYSRGWTNGKRSGPAGAAPSVGLVDMEPGYLNPELADMGIFPGHIQMSPQARLRTLDYNHYLVRKLGLGSGGNLNTRKQPLWFGVMGMDAADTPASASQTSSGSSNSSPSGASNDF